MSRESRRSKGFPSRLHGVGLADNQDSRSATTVGNHENMTWSTKKDPAHVACEVFATGGRSPDHSCTLCDARNPRRSPNPSAHPKLQTSDIGQEASGRTRPSVQVSAAPRAIQLKVTNPLTAVSAMFHGDPPPAKLCGTPVVPAVCFLSRNHIIHAPPIKCKGAQQSPTPYG